MHKSHSEVSTKSTNFVKKTFDAIWKKKNDRHRSISAVEIYESMNLDKDRTGSVKSMLWTCFYIGQSSSFLGPSSTTIENLGDTILRRIFGHLDGKDIFNISIVNARFRRIVLKNIDSFARYTVRGKEVIYRFNQRLNEVQIQVLSVGRSFGDRIHPTIESCKRLSELLPKTINFEGTVVFENNVPVSRHMQEIKELYKTRRFIPTKFSFKGGSLSENTTKTGANLRGLRESEFVELIRFFKPHLKSVHLMTSRNFKLDNYPPKFLFLFDQLGEFLMTYEYPTLQIRLVEIFEAVKKWQTTKVNHSTTYYIHRPYCTKEEIVERTKKTQPIELEVNGSKILKIVFAHPFRQFTLSFVFHG